MRAGEIAAMLAQDAEQIASMLLPSGKKEATEWRAGDVSGSAGKSLGVRLTGPKAGTWKDFATDEGGDLLDLWTAARGLSLADAITQAKEHLGIRDTKFTGPEVKSYRKPERPKVSKPRDTEMDYLAERKLDPRAIDAYKIAARSGELVFPHLRNGELVALKYMRLNADKANKWRWESGCEPCLFGWQAVPDSAREVVICEGHMDAPSWWQMGKPALSVPNGAGALDWIELEYDNLERFDTIWIAFDNDAAGQKAIPEVVDRLGRERCRVLDMPKGFKDGNDLLRAGVDALKVLGIFEKARALDPEELKPASYFEDKVLDIFTGKAVVESGLYTPWPKVGSRFRFRYGEVTVVAGENFHGKSEAAGHMAVDVMAQGELACVASLEFKPERWLARCAQQVAGMPGKDLRHEYAQAAVKWFDGKLWAFDLVGNTKGERILEVFAYARRRYGIRFFVIDNLQKCGFDNDDHNAIKKFIDKLTDFAKEHDVHVLLVHHVNKSGDESQPATKRNILGTGSITDMVENVIIWWRNRPKEKNIESLKASGTEIPPDVLEKPDAMMIVEKQRNGDGPPPKVLLWFHSKSHQFVGKKDDRPKQYVRFQDQSRKMAMATDQPSGSSELHE